MELRKIIPPVLFRGGTVGCAPPRLRGGGAGRAAGPLAADHSPRAHGRAHATPVAAACAPLAPRADTAVQELCVRTKKSKFGVSLSGLRRMFLMNEHHYVGCGTFSTRPTNQHGSVVLERHS